MDWILQKAIRLADNRNVKLGSAEWQSDSLANSENHFLAVAGGKRKRVMKQFSKFELENCVHDEQLQQDVMDRLDKMIKFLGA